MAVPCGHQRLTGVDTITMSISSCASGDRIHMLSLGACSPPVSGDKHTLIGFLRGYKGTVEGVEKE